MIERKLKVCKDCKKDKYLWSHGRCKTCATLHRLGKSKESLREDLRDVLSDDNNETYDYPSNIKKSPQKQRKSLIDGLKLLYSEVIRLQHSNKQGSCECVTCGRSGYYRKDIIQCGHIFNVGSHPSVRFDLDNALPQCVFCNYHYQSDAPDIKVVAEGVYGDEKYSELTKRANTVIKYSIDELELIKDNLQQIKKELLSKKDLNNG